jgi:hypothetical protein
VAKRRETNNCRTPNVETMKENVQWLNEQVRPNSRATRDRQR